jgi:4-hydroxyphenylpyruvate dioxygenase
MDTFHIAARVAGDPFNSITLLRSGDLSDLASNLKELRDTVSPAQIGYFQLSHATLADIKQTGYPVINTAQPEFMAQSRNCRIFPCKPTKYGSVLPALDVAKAVFNLGYRGWVSMEVFNGDLWNPRTS